MYLTLRSSKVISTRSAKLPSKSNQKPNQKLMRFVVPPPSFGESQCLDRRWNKKRRRDYLRRNGKTKWHLLAKMKWLNGMGSEGGKPFSTIIRRLSRSHNDGRHCILLWECRIFLPIVKLTSIKTMSETLSISSKTLASVRTMHFLLDYARRQAQATTRHLMGCTVLCTLWHSQK